MEICDYTRCTGCGMCTNICMNNAIKMVEGVHGFIFPEINSEKCVNCGLCTTRCPANNHNNADGNTMNKIYAAWSRKKCIREQSSSGGIFSLLAEAIITEGGLVAGVQWNSNFCPEHRLTDTSEVLVKFRGSKYVQSNTGTVYFDVKEALNMGRQVLFSGTPCQIAALKSYLGKEYSNLFTIDLVCHGVPSYECFQKYLNEKSCGKQIENVQLRYKSPYWDYCSVRIDYKDGTYYQELTVDDPYFTLFNIGYSLRESCHNCPHTSSHREGDITLADFWSYAPSKFKMCDYNKGTSLVAINTDKGEYLFQKIQEYLIFEEETYEMALKSNRSFTEPYTISAEKLDAFWKDYEKGMKIIDLCKKYVSNPFKLPNLLFLRRLKRKYNWVIK